MVDENKIQKPLEEYDEEENKQFQLNSRGIYILVCAKEVWRILEITHERTNQVKDSKVRILVSDYEIFKMKRNESIVEMFTRFTDVVNGLEGLGNRVSEEDNVSKILRCLPPKWNSKTEAIEEAKILKDYLLRNLSVP